MTNKWAGLAALLAGFFVILLDTTIVAVASPRIQQDLHAGISGLFWVAAGYLLAFSVPLLVAGRLGDRYDPKRVFLAGIGSFAVASALCALAPSVGWLVLFRVVQGLAAAAMAPQALTLIRRLFIAAERGRVLGLWGTVASAGALLGPLLGGLLTAALDWRWIFLINVPLCCAALLMGLRWIPGSRGHTASLDLLGAMLSTAGLGVLVWALLAWRDTSASVIAAAGVIAVALLTGFVVRQRRIGSAALTPATVFGSAGFLAASAAVAALGTVVIAMALPTMLYLQDVRGLGPLQAALVMTPDAVVAALLSPAAGRWVDRVGPRRPAILGMALLAVSLMLIGLVVVLGIDPWWAAPGAVVLGIANAVAWSPLSVAAMASVNAADAGAASGVFSTTRQVAAVTAVAVTGAILAGLRTSPTLAFSVVFALMTVIASAGVVAAIRLPRTSTDGGGGSEGAVVVQSHHESPEAV